MIWLTSFFSKSSIQTGPKNVTIEIKWATRRLLGTSSYIFKELLLFGRTLCLPSVGGARFWCMSRRLYSGKWRGSHFRWFLRNLSITSRDKQFQAWTCFKKLARVENYISVSCQLWQHQISVPSCIALPISYPLTKEAATALDLFDKCMGFVHSFHGKCK